ncbi:MAG: efflux RND transporter permease subunit [Geminicoccaceae bacterium]
MRIEETVAPKEAQPLQQAARRRSRRRSRGYSMGEALAFLDAEAAKLPPGMVTDLNGQSREFRTSTGGLYITFLLALAFIYLVLSAGSSWVDPFIIMLTVPLSMTSRCPAGAQAHRPGAPGRTTVDRPRDAGRVDHQARHPDRRVRQQLEERGPRQARGRAEAATLRLQPILMTTGAMVLGSVPMALRRPVPVPEAGRRSAG